jgi:hypothetical protein
MGQSGKGKVASFNEPQAPWLRKIKPHSITGNVQLRQGWRQGAFEKFMQTPFVCALQQRRVTSAAAPR